MTDTTSFYDDYQTEWNGSLGTLIRIDQLLRLSHDNAMNSDYNSQYNNLTEVMIECKAYTKPNEDKEVDELWTKLTNTMALLSANRSEPVYNDFRKQLFNFNIWLMKYMGKKGMLMTNKENDKGL